MILTEQHGSDRVILDLSLDEFRKLLLFFGEEKLGPYEHQLCPYDQWQEWDARYKPDKFWKIVNRGGSMEIRALEKP